MNLCISIKVICLKVYFGRYYYYFIDNLINDLRIITHETVEHESPKMLICFKSQDSETFTILVTFFYLYQRQE